MIYADYNGSAPLNDEIAQYLKERLVSGPFANPNAIHSLGRKMSSGLEKARSLCAQVLGCEPEQIIFNSGSSEGITHVFHHILGLETSGSVITSEIEHSAVVQACQFFEGRGLKVYKVKTLADGQIDLAHFKELITANNDIRLVSIMAANNETGVIQPWKEISDLCQEQKIPFFSDTTQYIGKTTFHFNNSAMDFAVLSGHKIGALIGSGLLMVKTPHKMKPLVFGGGQEYGLRGGTQNYVGAETMALALKQFEEKLPRIEALTQARIQFEEKIKHKYPQVVIVGDKAQRLASTTLIAFPGIHGQAVQIELESRDIFVTTSSACSDNEPETSKVLRAMGVDDKVGRGVVRISLCINSQPEEYLKIEKALDETYAKLSQIKSYQ